MLPCHQGWILGESPALEASKASGDGVHVTTMGVLPFMKASLKNQPGSCRWFLEESLTMPVALHLDSLWSVLQLFDLTMLGVVDNVADALPLLLIPRRMLCRRLFRWRMLCRRVVGLLSGRCFAAESDLALPLLRMLCRSGYLRFFPGGCLATGWFVGGCFAIVWFVGGCFAAVTAGRSSV